MKSASHNDEGVSSTGRRDCSNCTNAKAPNTYTNVNESKVELIKYQETLTPHFHEQINCRKAKETELISTIEQMNLIVTCKTPHPTDAEYTLFSSVHKIAPG